MHLLRDPNVAFAAIIIGMLVGYVELIRPGWVVPGVAGLMMVMLGISSLAQRQISLLSLLGIAAALVLIGLDAAFQWRGIASLCAAALLVLGARGLVREDRVQWAVAVGLCVPFVVITARLLTIALQARYNKLSP